MASSFESLKTSQEKGDSENVPPASLSGAASTTTPLTQNQNVKGKPLSGLQSALTPILKYLNIGNKSTSPLNTNSQRKPSAEDKMNSCADSVQNENLPEVTLLDGTFDSTMNNIPNAQCGSNACTPIFLEFKKSMNFLDVNINTPFPWIHAETLPEVSLLDTTCDTTMLSPSVLLDNVPGTPFCKTGTPKSSAGQNDMDSKTNTTLPLEKRSLVSEKEATTLETAHDCTPPKRPFMESSETNSAETVKIEVNQSLENMTTTFNGNLTHSNSSGSGVTQDISMRSTLDGSQSKPVTAELPINITHDLSTSNASDQSEILRSSGRYSNNATFDVSPEEKPSCIAETTSGNNPVTGDPLNNTFTIQTSALQNQTMEIINSNQSPPVPENQSTNVNTKQNCPESSLVLNDNCSDSKSSLTCEKQNQTFEKNSLQKSSASTITIVVQASGTSLSLQNTFESKPEENKTSTEPIIPEISGEPMQATPVSDKSTENREGTNNVSANAAAEEISNFEAKDSLNSGNHLGESIDHNIESRKSGTFILDSSLDFKSASLFTSTPMVTNKSFNFTEEREQGKTTAAQKRLYGEGPSKPGFSASSEVPSNIVCNLKTFLPATKPNIPSLRPPSLLSKFKPATLLPKRPELATSGQPTTRQIETSKTSAAQSFQQATTSKLPISYSLRSTAAAASALNLPVSGLRKPAVGSMPSSLRGAWGGLKPPQASKCTSAVAPGPGKPAAGTNNLSKTTLLTKRQPLQKGVTLPAAKKKRTDNPLPSNKDEATSSSDTTAKVKTLKASTQRTLPSKSLKHVPSSSSDSATACESTSRVGPVPGGLTVLTDPSDKPQCHNCEVKDEEMRHLKEDFEAQLNEKDEEIKRLKEELAQLTGGTQPQN